MHRPAMTLDLELDLPRSCLLSRPARHGAGGPLGPEVEGAVLSAPVHVTLLLLFLGASAEPTSPEYKVSKIKLIIYICILLPLPWVYV